MTICMSKIICVTNRKLVKEDFLSRIEKICRFSPYAVLLREKDLPQDEYLKLAESVKKICDFYNVHFISHTFLSGKFLHMPLEQFSLETSEIPQDIIKGTSVHSVEDAVKAESLGADYLIAGHVFETACKAGLKGRGLSFVEEVSKSVSIPVFAIGGISPNNYKSVLSSGAQGFAIMSSAMTIDNLEDLFFKLTH